MSVSSARATVDIDLDDLERRLRAAVTPAGVEDPLAELARLVEASRPKPAEAAPPRAAPVAPAPPAPPLLRAAPVAPPAPPPQPLETGALRPAFDDAAERDRPRLDAAAEEEPAYDADPAPPAAPGRAKPRSSRWVWTVSGLAVAGVAMIGAVFALRGHVPGMPKSPPFIAAAVGPTKVQPPSDATVAATSDAGANLLKDNTQASKVTVVSNEEQPVDLGAQSAAAAAAAPAATAPAAASAPATRGPVDTPIVVAPPAAAPAAPAFPEPKPVRTISLRPDGTPIPASAAADAAPSQPAAAEPAAKPAKGAAKPAADAAAPQPSTPKIDLPTRLPKSSARVAVAKTDTTVPGGAADAAAGEPAAKAEKPAKAKAQESATATAAAVPAEPAAAEPVAASSGGWAVQLAAPRSEEEAKSVASKLGAKYASALGGAPLGVHKGASSNGDTVYRVRVTGLSKADAAALCARVKGDGGQCFVAK